MTVVLSNVPAATVMHWFTLPEMHSSAALEPSTKPLIASLATIQICVGLLLIRTISLGDDKG